MIKKFNEERGIAMVTALLVSLVVLFLSIVVVALSLHNSTISSFDRKRIQSVDAAEAGIDAWFSGLVTSTGGAVCNGTQWDGTLPTTPNAAYDVSITLYSGWPPVPGLPPLGNEMTCPVNPTDPLPADPLGALVISKGTAATSGSATVVSRTMQSEVRFTPIYGGFNKAIFSDTVLNIQNKLFVNGYQGNDGDVYTNGNFSLNNNTVISGSVYAQGHADIAQGIVKANTWANNYVRLTNGLQVFGNATSSTSYISLDNNSTVFGNAKAGTTISGGTIKGTSTQNSPSGAPPKTVLPKLTYNQCAWTCPPPTGAGYTEVDYSSCAAAQAFISAGAVGNYVVKISPTCALVWGNNSTVNIKGNLAIITDGSITTQNQTTWNAVGGKWTVFFIRPYQAGLNCTKPSPYDISISNNTNFDSNLTVFVYSQCNVDFGNNNAGGVNGQIIGGTVNITNQMSMNYVPVLVPGFNLTGYNVQPSYLREIANSPTP
jgi:hypothetical protein